VAIPNSVLRIEPGAQLLIRKGTFAGMSAELAEAWSGEEVVQLIVTVFGRRVQIQLDPWSLEPPLLPREVEWPPGTSLSRMVISACSHGTERQIRLFAVACCRRIFHLMTEDRCRKLVEEANRCIPNEEQVIVQPDFLRQTVEKVERLADGGAVEGLAEDSDKADSLNQVRRNYYASHDESDGPVDHELMAAAEAAGAVCAACPPDALSVARYAARAVYRATGGEEDGEDIGDPAETAAQCELVRDIFGRPPSLEYG
jgi:hypothetical protein